MRGHRKGLAAVPILSGVLFDRAQVPYIAGMPRGPDNLREDLVVVFLDSNKVVSGTPIEKLPEFTKLYVTNAHQQHNTT